MIRILFTIVAVVAAILAVVIQEPLLFIAAGISLAVTIVLMVVRIQRRRASYKQAAPPPPAPEPASESDEDLASLGILEIRPRSKSGNEPREMQEPADADRDGVSGDGTTNEVPNDSPSEEPPVSEAPEPGARSQSRSESRANGVREPAREPSRVQNTFTIKEKAQIVRASVDESAPPHFSDILIPYLQACRAAVDANTVCLLKQPDETPHYHIEAIVSLNAYARSGGTFSSRQLLLERHDPRATPRVCRYSDGTLGSHTLGYYRETIAIKELAVASVPHPSAKANFVLLADAMQEHTLDSDRKLGLINHFARLLGAVLDKGVTAEVLQEAEDYVRPRREIIGDEINRAKRENKPLALALVYLNRAEEIADRGDRAITNTEKALEQRLGRSARGARVERFGELTYGVFFKAGGAEVERWAVELQRELEQDGPELKGGVSIGIALLQDRHVDADSFRRDATDALREAYESGTCTIVE